MCFWIHFQMKTSLLHRLDFVAHMNENLRFESDFQDSKRCFSPLSDRIRQMQRTGTAVLPPGSASDPAGWRRI